MRTKYLLLIGMCLCFALQAKAQVLRVQLPFMNVSQGWQVSRWDRTTENRLGKIQTLGLIDVAFTVKNRITIDASFQLESLDPDYISLPDYLDRANINLPDRRTLLNNLSLGSAYKYHRANLTYRGSLFKFGLAKNWWFKKWTIDLGMRYVFYSTRPLMGVSAAFSSGERFYRLDRWSQYNINAFEGYIRPTWLLSNRISLSAHLNWLVRKGEHGIYITRLSGLDIPWEEHTQLTTSTEHFFYFGLGLYYTLHFKKK